MTYIGDPAHQIYRQHQKPASSASASAIIHNWPTLFCGSAADSVGVELTHIGWIVETAHAAAAAAVKPVKADKNMLNRNTEKSEKVQRLGTNWIWHTIIQYTTDITEEQQQK